MAPIGELCALAAATTWAVGSILFAGLGRTVPAGAMNLGKLVAAGVLLSVTHVVLGGALLPPSASTHAIVLLSASGLLGLSLGDWAYFAAMDALGVARAMLLLSTAPVFAALGGRLWLDERLDARSGLGMALTIGGVVLVVMRRTPAPKIAALAGAAPRPSTARGVALGIVSALGQAGGSLLSRRAMQEGIDPLAAAAGRLIVGAVGLFAIAMVWRRARPWIAALRRDRAWLKVGLAAVIGSYVGIWLAQIALQRSRSTGVATTLLATPPVLGLPLAHAVGLDRITPRALFGAVVAVAGIALLSIR